MIIHLPPDKIVVSRSIQGLCALPYRGHPHGCPNFRERETCPPGLPLIDSVLDFGRDIYAIATPFPVGEFAERMRASHPQWAAHPREWYNPRRWQPTARKAHREEQHIARERYGLAAVVGSPEAHGVDVTATLRNVGVELSWEWPPRHDIAGKGYAKNVVYTVSLGGTPLKR